MNRGGPPLKTCSILSGISRPPLYDQIRRNDFEKDSYTHTLTCRYESIYTRVCHATCLL